MPRSIRRRRLQAKTDYKARLSLLSSGKARLVLRKTNQYIIAQIVETKIAQDSVVSYETSRNLLAYGWPQAKAGSLKGLGAAYLTGYALGKKAQGKIKEAILDFGMYRNIHKSRLYAALKGAIDAGLSVPHGPEVLPTIEMIEARDKELIHKVKARIDHG